MSISSAVEQGTEMLELDVHLTKDGHVVVSHDENLLRQTGHDVDVSSLTLQVGGSCRAAAQSEGHVVFGPELVSFFVHQC